MLHDNSNDLICLDIEDNKLHRMLLLFFFLICKNKFLITQPYGWGNPKESMASVALGDNYVFQKHGKILDRGKQ